MLSLDEKQKDLWDAEQHDHAADKAERLATKAGAKGDWVRYSDYKNQAQAYREHAARLRAKHSEDK